MKKRKTAVSRKKLIAQLNEKDHLLRNAKLVSLLLAAFNLFLLSVLFTTYYNVLPIKAQVYEPAYSQPALTP